MNHLHQVIEAANERKIYYRSDPGPLNSPRWGRVDLAIRTFLAASSGAIVFDGGDGERLNSVSKVVTELCRLPFPICWFEFSIPEEESEKRILHAAMCVQDANGRVMLYVFQRDRLGWVFIDLLFSKPLIAGGLGGVEFDGSFSHNDEYGVQVCGSVVQCVRLFLSALNCHGVVRVEEKADLRLQKARARRGKPPLFSTWTLDVLLPHDGETSGGGDDHHDGERRRCRVHLVRGHPRQYAPGKWTWVQPFSRGETSLGIVHKDYRGKIREGRE